MYFRYFPTVRGVWGGAYSVSLFIACFALYAAPVAINVIEDRKWKALESKLSALP
jgi:energy-coupling factor transport system permease protein